MAMVIVKPGESVESALKRFTRKCESEGILKEMRDHQFFIPRSKRNRKSKATKKVNFAD